jgi:hypothetical protein
MYCCKCTIKIVGHFYTDFDGQGNFKPYCESCYNSDVTSRWPNIKPWGTEIKDAKCECGAEKVGSNKHSSWCGRDGD